MTMKKLFICIVVVCTIGNFLRNVQAQPNPLFEKFTPQQLKEDFQRMRQELETVQPGLYEYTSKAVMDQYLDSLYTTLDQSMTALQFLHTIKPILTKIRNGHNNIYPSKKAIAYIRAKNKFMPFRVIWLGNKLYVKEAYTPKTTIPLGSEILTINGQPSQEILHTLLSKYATSDGYNKTFPRRLITAGFGGAYYLYIKQSEEFIITYKTSPQASEQTVTLPGVSVQTVREYAKNKKALDKAADKMLAFKMLDASTGLLRVGSFSKSEIKKGGQSFKKFLKNTFKVIAQKQLKSLILDVRDNGGGDDGYGNLLFSYLTNRPFNYYKYVETKVSRIAHPRYYEGTGSIRLANLFFRFKLRKMAKNSYHFKKNPGLGTFQPQKTPFLGNLYILINGGCFSATGEFASCVHYNKRGKFIGEEVGGNYYKNTSGEMLPLILPHTKTRVTVTLMQYVMDVENYSKGRGVKPDFLVTYTIQDILQGKDLVLEKAQSLIKREQLQQKK